METDILKKYIKGELPEDVAEKVTAQLEKDRALREEFCRMCAEEAFDSLPDTFDGSGRFNGMELPGASRKKSGPSRFRRVARTIINVAAVLFIPLAVIETIRFFKKDEPETGSPFAAYYEYRAAETFISQKTNPGIKGSVTLPDGSRVCLNSCSSISFPAEFDSTARVVRLEGEAYFEVETEPSRPMFIECRDRFVVKVTGTEFNITTYADDDSFKLLLVSGSLSVQDKTSGEIFSVNPSEQLVLFDGTDRQPIRELPDIEEKTAWKDGKLLFENTAMPEVLRRIERWYGVTVKVADERILDYRITASFESESVSKIFDLLALSSGIEYSIEGNTVTIDIKK